MGTEGIECEGIFKIACFCLLPCYLYTRIRRKYHLLWDQKQFCREAVNLIPSVYNGTLLEGRFVTLQMRGSIVQERIAVRDSPRYATSPHIPPVEISIFFSKINLRGSQKMC